MTMCDECGLRPARFHIATIAQHGRQTERDLCPECMTKHYRAFKGAIPSANLERIVGHLKDMMAEMHERPEMYGEYTEYDGLTCEVCGTTYAQIRNSGKLGCANCYKTMREPIEKMLEQRQGSTQHTGKIPSVIRNGVSLKMNIESLKSKLQKAIQSEEYEQAAKYRDAIRALELKLTQEEQGGEEIRVRPPFRIDFTHEEETCL